MALAALAALASATFLRMCCFNRYNLSFGKREAAWLLAHLPGSVRCGSHQAVANSEGVKSDSQILRIATPCYLVKTRQLDIECTDVQNSLYAADQWFSDSAFVQSFDAGEIASFVTQSSVEKLWHDNLLHICRQWLNDPRLIFPKPKVFTVRWGV